MARISMESMERGDYTHTFCKLWVLGGETTLIIPSRQNSHIIKKQLLKVVKKVAKKVIKILDSKTQVC